MIQEKYFHHLTFLSLLCFALFVFTSFSLAASYHVFIFIPGLYFYIKDLKSNKSQLSPSSWALLALIAISILSIVFNSVENPVRVAFKLRYFLVGILSVYAFKYWLTGFASTRKIKIIVNCFLIATTLATVSGLIGLYFGFNPLRFKEACHAYRNCGMYGMFITYGYSIQFFCLIVSGLLIYRKKLTQIIDSKILYIAALVNFLGFYLSYTRGALLGFLVAFPFFFFKRNKKRFFQISSLLFFLTMASLIVVPRLRDFVTDIDRITSTNHRLSQYHAAWVAAMNHPWFGLGYRNFESQVIRIKIENKIPFEWRGGHGHSNFFEHLASTGFLGFLALLLFHVLWFKEAYQRNDSMGDFTLAFVIAVFTSGWFQYTLGDGENLFVIMMIYSLSQLSSSFLALGKLKS